MRRFVLLGITATGKTETIQGPEKSASDQRDAFRKLAVSRKKKGTDEEAGTGAAAGYAEVQLAEIVVIRRKRFSAVKLKGAVTIGKRTVARTVDKKGKRHIVDTVAATRADRAAAHTRAAASRKTTRRRGAKTGAKKTKAAAPAAGDEGTFASTTTTDAATS